MKKSEVMETLKRNMEKEFRDLRYYEAISGLYDASTKQSRHTYFRLEDVYRELFGDFEAQQLYQAFCNKYGHSKF